MSRDRLLPRALSYVSPSGVPFPAMWAPVPPAMLFSTLRRFGPFLATGPFPGLLPPPVPCGTRLRLARLALALIRSSLHVLFVAILI